MLKFEWVLFGFMVLCATMAVVKMPRGEFRSKWREIWPAEAAIIGMACFLASELIPATTHLTGPSTMWFMVLRILGLCGCIGSSIATWRSNRITKRPVRRA